MPAMAQEKLKMALIDILVWIIVIVLGLIFVSLGFFIIFWVYGLIETRRLKKKIPEAIKKEVEDERRKREARKAGTGDIETERALESARTGIINQEPAGIQQDDLPDDELNDVGNVEAEGRNESVGRDGRKFKWARI
jgi:hypothetical protein